MPHRATPGSSPRPPGTLARSMGEPALDPALHSTLPRLYIRWGQETQGPSGRGCAPHGGAPLDDVLPPNWPRLYVRWGQETALDDVLPQSWLAYILDGARRPSGPSGRVARPMEEPPLDDVLPPSWLGIRWGQETKGTLWEGYAPHGGARWMMSFVQVGSLIY